LFFNAVNTFKKYQQPPLKKEGVEERPVHIALVDKKPVRNASPSKNVRKAFISKLAVK